tara:strand:- start:243 stop:479 length:237 start_codon:yes stop_codon:yes gene_type:complete
MKIALTIVMCSTLANTCLDPHTFPKIYDSYYDCLLDGYQKSLDKTKEIGKKETNLYQIYSKFGCKEVITPPPKPKIKA